FLQPSFWRLKKTLQARYDFSRHAVAPAWSKVLGDLAAEHAAAAAYAALRQTAGQQWHTEDAPGVRQSVVALRADGRTAHPSVKALIQRLGSSDDAVSLVGHLAGLRARFAQLDGTLRFLLVEHQRFDFGELAEVLGALREQMGVLAELLPVLGELGD